jgi:hypothetical protein
LLLVMRVLLLFAPLKTHDFPFCSHSGSIMKCILFNVLHGCSFVSSW